VGQPSLLHPWCIGWKVFFIWRLKYNNCLLCCNAAVRCNRHDLLFWKRIIWFERASLLLSVFWVIWRRPLDGCGSEKKKKEGIFCSKTDCHIVVFFFKSLLNLTEPILQTMVYL
jgi:hypothetical protein